MKNICIICLHLIVKLINVMFIINHQIVINVS